MMKSPLITAMISIILFFGGLVVNSLLDAHDKIDDLNARVVRLETIIHMDGLDQLYFGVWRK